MKKRKSIEKSIYALYRPLPFPLGAKVVIFTWVIGDGLGDFSAQIEAARALLTHFSSQIQLSLVTLYPSHMQLSCSLSVHEHHYVPYEDTGKGDWHQMPPVLLPARVLTLCQEAACLVQMPTYYPWTADVLQSCQKEGSSVPFYEFIAEGGWSKIPHVADFRSLGFYPEEVGLFFPPMEKVGSLASLEDGRLRQICLSGGVVVSAYLAKKFWVRLFLESVVEMMKEETQDITLCLFPCEEIIRLLPSLGPLLQEGGIRNVILYYEEHVVEIPMQEKGKTLRLVQVKKMERKDYFVLLNASFGLVGCRGDGSLSEAFAAGKLPFFDLPYHKIPLLQGLVHLAQEKLGKEHALCHYFQEFLKEQPDPKKIGRWAKDQELQHEFRAFSSYIQEFHSAGTFLQNLVLRAVYHHLYPEMAFAEAMCLVAEEEPEKILSQIAQVLETTKES